MYQLEMISVMKEENLQLKQAMVEEILVKNGKVQELGHTGVLFWALL